MYIPGYEIDESSPTFRVPENFDRYGKGKGWEAYHGGNDWERGSTGVAVYLNPEGYQKEMARIWFEVKFPPHLQEYVSSSKHWSAPSSRAVKEWGDKAARRWMRETVNVRRATRKRHGAHDGYHREWTERKSWKECFILALESPKLKPFVKQSGVDRTKWVGMRRSASDPINESLEEASKPSKFWWMDKDGNLTPVANFGHGEAGKDILRKQGVDTESVYTEMYARGYIRVGFAGLWGQYHIEINYARSKPPSLTQWKALKDLAIEMGADTIEDDARGGKIRVDESRLLFENFHENKEWFLYEGDHTLTAVFEDNSRQTFKVHFHEKRLREDREKHRKRAAGTWKRLATEIRKSAGISQSGNPVVVPWQECFQKALQDPMMLEFVDDLRATPIFESWQPLQNLWLSPEGAPNKVASHEAGGYDLLVRIGKIIPKVKGTKSIYDSLYSMGYARVIIGDNQYPLLVDRGHWGRPKLTKAQREWVEETSFALGLNGDYSGAGGEMFTLEASLNEMTYDELHQSMRDFRTRRDLRQGTKTGSDSRDAGAQNVNVRSLRVISTVGQDGNEHETSMFSYKSRSSDPSDSRTAKQRWQGYIRFIQESEESAVAKTHEQSDVEVNCTCPDYKYVWAKANSDVDAGETGKTTTGGFSSAGPVSKIEPRQTQYKSQGSKPVNIFEAQDVVAPAEPETQNVDIDKRWKFQGGNTNNGTYGKKIRNPQNTPGLCKHLIALADYIEKKAKPEPVAPVEPGQEEEPSAVAEPSKLKKTGKPVNIFEAIKQFAQQNPTFDVPYED